ncbi:MAG: YciI family protein [Verrucomicrobiota bacterium]
MSTNSSPYMLLFRDSSPSRYATLSPEQMQQFFTEWHNWYDRLAAEGKLDHGRPLEPEGRLVSGVHGDRITDGPFAESKESIAGYFLLTVGSMEEATEIARSCPSLRHGAAVEIRQVAGMCPIARSMEERRKEELLAV